MKSSNLSPKNFLIAGLAFVAIMTVTAPYVASADTIGVKSNVFSLDTLKGPLLICVGAPVPGSSGGAGPVSAVCNNLCDLVAQFANIIYFFIAVVIWIVVPALVAVGGIMYMLAGPNPSMVERAKKTLTGAVWGLAIVLCAWVIVYTFANVVGIGGIGGFSTKDVNGNSVGGVVSSCKL